MLKTVWEVLLETTNDLFKFQIIFGEVLIVFLIVQCLELELSAFIYYFILFYFFK